MSSAAVVIGALKVNIFGHIQYLCLLLFDMWSRQEFLSEQFERKCCVTFPDYVMVLVSYMLFLPDSIFIDSIFISPEYLKWTHPSPNLDTSIVIYRNLIKIEKKNKKKQQQKKKKLVNSVDPDEMTPFIPSF